MTRYTADSLPGISEEARMTVSPSAIRIGWSRAAIRDSADMGSPWDPVQTRTTSPGGMPSASRGSTSSPPRTEGTLR